MDILEQIVSTNATEELSLHLVPEEVVRERAYEIYERRGRQDGQSEQDWFEAEMELRNEVQTRQQSWT